MDNGLQVMIHCGLNTVNLTGICSSKVKKGDKVKAGQLIMTFDREKLKEENEIYIITARGSFLSHSADVMTIEENRNIVLNWLKKNEIHYDKIIFSPEDKLDICRQNNIDLMIEDKPKNINTISSEIPVICYHANYNEQCNGKNIYRCYSWYDIYRKIKEILK